MSKLRIALVGCGNVAMSYLRNAAMFNGVELRACADVVPEMAKLRAQEYGIRAWSMNSSWRTTLN
jgi:predicted dehydrogenase